ncbi:MAG: hypothetical protein PHI11_09570 [Gallionella sp.]|nr:hypothetical protein [Gallionella sp.]
MKWRDVLVGAVASLTVTVLGGVSVYYATKEPDEKKVEKLTYSLNQTASFTGSTQNLSFSTVTVSNEGGVAAKKVSIVIGVQASQIRDVAVNAERGLREIAQEKTAKSLRVAYETLLPKESVTINLLLSEAEKPTIDVRSEATLGEEQKRNVTDSTTLRSKLNVYSVAVVPVSGLISIVILVGLLTFIRRRGLLDHFPDRNDAGFLLLHHGLIDEAAEILSESVRAGRCDQYTLSNYALCKAAKGEIASARQLIQAAEFRDRTGHGKAVLLFNEALVHLLDGNRDAALDSLRQAIELSPNKIRRYCQRSVHLNAVRSEPAFYDLFKDA